MAVKRQPGERGMALFIVVLVVTLLTAIGVFAIHATSMAQAASGYSRRAAAAMHLAEFAMNAVGSDMGGKEVEYHKKATARDLVTQEPVEDCRANRGLGTDQASCHVVDTDNATVFLPSGVASDVTGPLFGLLGRDQSIRATFRVEIHDVGPAPDPQLGMPTAGSAVTSQSWQAAFTTTGAILPVTTDPNLCTANATRASENLNLRGLVVYTTPPM